MGNRNSKAIDKRAVMTANNSRKIGEFIKEPSNRKQRRAKKAAGKKCGHKGE
jgi:hypothetical protein